MVWSCFFVYSPVSAPFKNFYSALVFFLLDVAFRSYDKWTTFFGGLWLLRLRLSEVIRILHNNWITIENSHVHNFGMKQKIPRDPVGNKLI